MLLYCLVVSSCSYTVVVLYHCSESGSTDFRQCYFQSLPINCTTGNCTFHGLDSFITGQL